MEKEKSSEAVKESVSHICHVCGLTLKTSSLKCHIESFHTDSVDEKIQCEHCPKTFRNRAAILNHVASHHNTIEPYKCDYCPRKFSRYGILKKHLLSHSHERTYKCQLCPKAFKAMNDVQRHMKTVHLNIRKFVCEECGADFNCNNHLKRHLTLHLKDKPFKCQFCGKECTQASNLKVHIMGVHKDLSHLVYEKKDTNRVILPTVTISSYKDYVKETNFQKPPKPSKRKEKPKRKRGRPKLKTQNIDKSPKDNSITKESPLDSSVSNSNEVNDVITKGEIVVEHSSNKYAGDVLNIEYVKDVAVKKEITSAQTDPLVLSDSLDNKEIIVKKEYEDDTLCNESYDEHSGDNLNLEYVKEVALNKNKPNNKVGKQVKKNSNYNICTSCKKKFKVAASDVNSRDTCNKCNARFTTKLESPKLYKTDSDDEPLCCKTCNKKCKSLWEFHIHLMVFHDTCAKCSKQLDSHKIAFRHYKNKCCSACDELEDPFEDCKKHR